MKQGKQKVLFVITKSNWGGAQRYVYDLATNLPKDEFDPIVAYGSDGALATRLRDAHIAAIALSSLVRDVSMFSDIRSLFELMRILREVRPDVVHLNSSKAAGLGALAARLRGVPRIVFTVHGWPFMEPRRAPTRAAIWLFSWITAILSDRVTCVSRYDLSLTRRMPFVKKKAACIHNGIDLHMSFGDGEVVRQAFPQGAVITGTIGELTRNKNQSALVEEAREKPSMHAAIVGEGEDRAMLEEKIRTYELGGRVKLFGYLPARDVLKGFDAFVLPSLKEGLPYVLIEAKLAGLPIIADKDVGGIGEILDSDISEFSLERMVAETTAMYRD